MLRHAEPKDAEAIGRIRVAAWRTAYQKFMPKEYLAALNPEENLTQLRHRLTVQNTDFILSVAEERGEVVAFSIVGKPRYNAAPGTMELWAINVLPEYWRMGIGSSLLERAIIFSCGEGCENLELWCMAGNTPAQRAYEKFGFIQSGQARSTSQLTGTTIHEVHYVKRL